MIDDFIRMNYAPRARRPRLWAIAGLLLCMTALYLLVRPRIAQAVQAPAAQAPETVKAASPAPMTNPSPTPWAGNGHWFFFQYVDPWGFVSSTGVKYEFLDYPYYVMGGKAVAIGKMKGANKEIKVYTLDPQERVIWADYRWWNGLVRSDVELPDPDPEHDPLTLGMGDMEKVLSPEASADLLALLRAAEAAGEPEDLDDRIWEIWTESGDGMHVSCTFEEIPGLRYVLHWDVIWHRDSWILLPWQGDYPQEWHFSGYILPVDPASPLCAEYDDAVAIYAARYPGA